MDNENITLQLVDVFNEYLDLNGLNRKLCGALHENSAYFTGGVGERAAMSDRRERQKSQAVLKRRLPDKYRYDSKLSCHAARGSR